MPWNKPLQLFLVMAIGLNTVPLLGLVPVWVSAVTGILILWKLLHLTHAVPLPPKLVTFFAGCAMIALIGFHRKTLLGQDAGTDLLVVFGSFKLLETHRYRDVMINVMICFFLLMINLLNSQSLLTLGFMMVDLVLITQVLLQLHPGNTSLVSLKSVLKLMMITLPLWAMLFFVFPRFSVGFMQSGRTIAHAGFSDSLNPGDLGQIVRSNEVAFRVRFDQGALRTDDLYWRGAILSTTESSGLKWNKASLDDYPPETYLKSNAKDSEKKSFYEVFLEPIYSHWLFKLDYPSVDQAARLQNNLILRRPGLIYEFQHDLASRVTYSSSRLSQMPEQNLGMLEQKFYEALPKTIEPEVIELAGLLKVKGQPVKSIEHLLAWYETQKFRYTLEPGPVPGRTLKGFLFKSKLGFCEHFAAATATLLRAMGIPTRVVIGFQGGEKNDLGNYYIIKSANAHAWNEAFIDTDDSVGKSLNDSTGDGLKASRTRNGRWVRVDSVSVISPVRLAMGSDYFQLPAGAQGSGDAITLSLSSSVLARLQKKLRLAWDAAEMQWGSFLLSYDFEFQQAWLKRMGVKNNSRATFWIALLVSIVLFIAATSRYLQRKAQVQDPALVIWRIFLKKLEKRGVIKKPEEGPSDYLMRAKNELPSHAGQIEAVGKLYLSLRYAAPSHPSHSLLSALRSAIKKAKL